MWSSQLLLLVFLVHAKCDSDVVLKLKLNQHKLDIQDGKNDNNTSTNFKPTISSVTAEVENTHPDTTFPPFALSQTPTVMSLLNRPDNTSTFTEINNGSDVCMKYKPPPPANPFHLQEMADIWQILYYNMPGILQCFRIHIRKVNQGEQISHKIRYGTFDNQVNWTNIGLEIRAMRRGHRKRHFLQGTDGAGGVLMNVIIIYDKQHDRYVLHEESADQWMVYRNLLLMRDCDSGGVAVFSKVPHLPSQRDVVEGVRIFGDIFRNGVYACNEEKKMITYYEEEDDPELDKF